jgi:hypothetical protein
VSQVILFSALVLVGQARGLAPTAIGVCRCFYSRPAEKGRSRKSTLQTDLADRLVYIFAAMESLLLRNEEPIQQNLGERMAFTIVSKEDTRRVEARRAVIRNLKDAYALRSKFVHHGHGIDELETVRAFMTNAWVLFTSLTKTIHSFDTKEDLIDHLEA